MGVLKKILKAVLIFFSTIAVLMFVIVGYQFFQIDSEMTTQKEVTKLLQKYEKSGLQDEDAYQKLKSYDKKYFKSRELKMLQYHNDMVGFVNYELEQLDPKPKPKKSSFIVFVEFVSENWGYILVFIILSMIASAKELVDNPNGFLHKRMSAFSNDIVKCPYSVKVDGDFLKTYYRSHESAIKFTTEIPDKKCSLFDKKGKLIGKYQNGVMI